MISNGGRHEAKSEGRWHYLAVNNSSALLRGITSKNNDGFCCLNCLHSLRTKANWNCIKKDMKTFCNTIMPSEDTKIL